MAFIINIGFAKPDVDFTFVRGAPTVITDAIFFAPLGNDLTDRISRNSGSFIRSSEGTFLVGNGTPKITKALTNIPRFEDDQLLIESDAENFCFNAYGVNETGGLWDNWISDYGTTTVTSASGIFDLTDYPDANWQRLQHDFTGGEAANIDLFVFLSGVDTFAQNDNVLVAFYLEGVVDFSVTKRLDIILFGRNNAGGFVESIVVDSTTLLDFSGGPTIVIISGTVSNVNTTRLDFTFGRIPVGSEPLNGDSCDLFISAVNMLKLNTNSSFIPTETVPITRETESGNTTWDFDDIPDVRDILAETLGTEIDSGTLTIDVLYKITADVGDHFYAGSVVGQYFVSLGTETADASNKVREVENQALGTLLLQWQPDYDDDIETDTDSGMMSGNAALDLLYNRISTTTPSIRSFDSVNTLIHPFSYDSGTLYNVALQWYLDVNDAKMRISAVDASVPWGTPAYTEIAFDGSFPIGTDLSLADTLLARTKLVNAKFFNSKLTDEQIETETTYD